MIFQNNISLVLSSPYGALSANGFVIKLKKSKGKRKITAVSEQECSN